MATRPSESTTSGRRRVSHGPLIAAMWPCDEGRVNQGEAAMPRYAESTLTHSIPMKTQGEIEAAICEGICRFEQVYMGRGPKEICTHLLGDLLVVRLKGVLTAAEQNLAKALPIEKGRDLLKQVRTHLIETARPVLEETVKTVTGVKVMTMHHDISTTTGEEVVLFSLVRSPDTRGSR